MLLALLAALVWSAVAIPPAASTAKTAQSSPARHAGDFALYARIAERVAKGDDYYASALDEQRLRGYPTRPFFTVRLPTLAFVNAALGQKGANIVAIALLFAAILAWQRALVEQPIPERIGATFFIFLGGLAAFEPRAGLSHELVAGLLLALALALRRQAHWWLALLALAAALAVRELALLFALLWLTVVAFERRWREVAALGVLIALFTAGIWLHQLAVVASGLPGDRASPGWEGLIGPGLVLGSLARLTALTVLPGWLAGPLALLPLLGWTALGGRIGMMASVWFVAFAAFMAIFARADNFYWAMIMLPAYAAGLAFIPRALADLWAAQRGAAPN